MHQCPKCDQTFTAMYKLYIHCRYEHPEVEFEFEPARVGTKTISYPVRVKP